MIVEINKPNRIWDYYYLATKSPVNQLLAKHYILPQNVKNFLKRLRSANAVELMIQWR